MATLTTKQRKAMPQKEYALPGKRFPVNDRAHAANAKARASQGVKAGPNTPAAPTVPTVIRQTSAPGAFWASASKGSTITAALSVALTAASIRLSFHYGLTSKLILNN